MGGDLGCRPIIVMMETAQNRPGHDRSGLGQGSLSRQRLRQTLAMQEQALTERQRELERLRTERERLRVDLERLRHIDLNEPRR